MVFCYANELDFQSGSCSSYAALGKVISLTLMFLVWKMGIPGVPSS